VVDVVGAVLPRCCDPGAVINSAVIVWSVIVPVTRTALPTGNCCTLAGAWGLPKSVSGVMITLYRVPSWAVIVQLDPFFALI
jgi:hypothetical protein